MMKRKVIQYLQRLCIVFLCSGVFYSAKAQDIHFSQFYFSSLAINPANTGSYYGFYRLSTMYKNQWASIANPYTTKFASVDFSLFKHSLGLGGSFLSDKAGKSQMGRTLVNFSAAYSLTINDENNFSLGLQYGIGQRSIQRANLKWDSQFNGTLYDSSLPTYEASMDEAYSYNDISAGVLWKYVGDFETTFGLAAFHLNQPKESFYIDDRLDRKIIFHHSSLFRLAEKNWFLLPQLMFVKQGPHNEFDIGGLVRYSIEIKKPHYRMHNRLDAWRKKEKIKENKNSVAFFAGAQFRFKDALITVVGFEFMRSLLFSYSYDVNVSKLRVASSALGGGEIALTFKGAF